MHIDTGIYAAVLEAAYRAYEGGGLDVMQAAVVGIGAALGETAADMALPSTQYADTAGAGAGAYVAAMWAPAGSSVWCALAGAVGQKLGEMYPLLDGPGASSSAST